MRRAATLFVLACTAAFVVATAATAGRPDFNPVCDGTKIEPVVDGTYAVPFGSAVGSITITVSETPQGQVFGFVTDSENDIVTSVVAKGGTAVETSYPNGSSGSGLHASLNPHSGYWYDLSYLCFNTFGFNPA